MPSLHKMKHLFSYNRTTSSSMNVMFCASPSNTDSTDPTIPLSESTSVEEFEHRSTCDCKDQDLQCSRDDVENEIDNPWLSTLKVKHNEYPSGRLPLIPLSDDHVVYTYPSGRLPLIPVNKGDKTKKSGSNEKEEQKSQNGSWLTRSFCVVSSNSALDTFSELSEQDYEQDYEQVYEQVYEQGSQSLDSCIANYESSCHGSLSSSQNSYDKEKEDISSTEGSICMSVNDCYDNEGGDTSSIEDNKMVSCDDSFHKEEDGICSPDKSVNITCNDSFDQSSYKETNKSTEPAIEHPTSIEEEPELLDDTFDTVIPNNSLFCGSLYDWYDNAYSTKKLNRPLTNMTQKHPPKNSVINVRAKMKKIQRLEQNMKAFELDDIELTQGALNIRKYSPVEFDRRSFSFSNVNTCTTPSSHKDSWQTKSKAATCGNLGHIPEVDLASKEETHQLYYDSDPCDMMPTRRSSRRRRKSQTAVARDDTTFVNGGDMDENLCLEKLCEHMSAKRLLIWHQQTTQNTSDSPIAIYAWIELGSQLNNYSLIQPKFCWQAINGNKETDKTVLAGTSTFHAVDLLDISKIIAVDSSLGREGFPFANRSSSFILEAFGGSIQMVFEARDELEREDIINGLKLVVSRLGSKIIIGDSTVLDEFFTPMRSVVPGGAPSIIATNENEDCNEDI